MSWTVIGIMAVGAYGFKALGLFGLSRVELSGSLEQLVRYLPAAMFAGLIVLQAMAEAPADIVATRVLGLVAGGVAVWLKAPLLVVIVVSAAVAALARLAI